MPCYSLLRSNLILLSIIHLLHSQDASLLLLCSLLSILFHPHLSDPPLNTRTKTFSTLCHKPFRWSTRGLYMQCTCCIPSLLIMCIALKVGRSSRLQSVYLSSYFRGYMCSFVCAGRWIIQMWQQFFIVVQKHWREKQHVHSFGKLELGNLCIFVHQFLVI